VELPTQISDDTLIKEGPHLERLDVAHLNLPHSKLTSLEPLKGLTNLSSLDLLDAAGITGLEPLKGLTNLSSLDLSYATGVTSLEPLKGLTKLSLLDLRNATGITSWSR
jgi:Leucine-rich repeat (LRR) protein